MNSPEILRRLVRQFGLLLLLMLIGGIAGAVYSAAKTPTYTARAYVVAMGDPGESITALNFAQAYGRIATSGPVLVKAGATLGADNSGLSKVTASTSPDAPVIEITATGPAAAHTAAVANAVANALADYGSTRRADTHVGLALLAGATTPRTPSSPKPPLELAVGAAGGLLIGALAVLAGVGRSTAVRDTVAAEEAEPVPDRYAEAEPAPARYEVAEVAQVQPAPDRPELERYTGVARAKHPPKAITSYREAAEPTPAALDPEYNADVAPTDPAIPAQRIVGRAVVNRMEDQ